MTEKTKEKFTTNSEAAKFELSPKPDGTGQQLTGYAIVWNVLSSDRGGYKVKILPGAVTFTEPVLALYDHNYAEVIGSTNNGTLRFASDDYGLKVAIDLPDTTCGRDVFVLTRDRYVTGMSFGTFPIRVEEVEANGEVVRVYHECLVDEFTVTAIPAFVETTIDVVNPVATPMRNLYELKLKATAA
jgi:HK97 family phage prohead protease